MIKLYSLTVGYYSCSIIPSVSGYIRKGSMVAVVGSNSTGKSTFLKTLGGFLSPVSGRLEYKSMYKPNVSYLPQLQKLDYNFPLTVFDVVSMGCWPKISLLKKLNKYQRILIWNALKTVNLLDLLDNNIKNLSGGQFQRMLFARILVQQAPLILLDEPLQGVDKENCSVMMHSIHLLCQKGCTAIIALHDYELIYKYFSCMLLLTRYCSFWKSFV